MTKKKSTKPTLDDRSDLQQFALDIGHALGQEPSLTKIRSSLLYRAAKEILKELPDLKAAGEYCGTRAWPENFAALIHGDDVTFRVLLRDDALWVECGEWRAQVGRDECARMPGLLRAFLAPKAVTAKDRAAIKLGREARAAAEDGSSCEYLRACADAAPPLFRRGPATADPELQEMLDRIMKGYARGELLSCIDDDHTCASGGPSERPFADDDYTCAVDAG